MSFQDAKQFIIDFYANPLIRMKIFKVQKKNLSHDEQVSQIMLIAKQAGYNFSLLDLIKAIKFKCKIQQLNDPELANIFGGANINYSHFNHANKKLKTIEQLIMLF